MPYCLGKKKKLKSTTDIGVNLGFYIVNLKKSPIKQGSKDNHVGKQRILRSPFSGKRN